jgi:hypothetical protein
MSFIAWFYGALLALHGINQNELPNTCNDLYNYKYRLEATQFITQYKDEKSQELQKLVNKKLVVLQCDKKTSGFLRAFNSKTELEQRFLSPEETNRLKEIYDTASQHKRHCPEINDYLSEHSNDANLSALDIKLLKNIKQQANNLQCFNHDHIRFDFDKKQDSNN